jgi:L-threonylcarbamoyladenylate synthase
MLSRHYAPRTPLELAGPEAAARVGELAAAGLRIGWVTFEGEAPSARPEVKTVLMPRDPAAYAARLYDVLHALDSAGRDRLVVTLPEESDAWLAVRDRLRRAATP